MAELKTFVATFKVNGKTVRKECRADSEDMADSYFAMWRRLFEPSAILMSIEVESLNGSISNCAEHFKFKIN